MGAVIAALVVALVVVVVADDGSDTSPVPTTTTAPATTTSTTTTTTRPTTTTTTPATTSTTIPLPTLTDDPQTYAQYLFAAWRNDDRAAAAKAASTDAVNQMFAQAYPAKGPYTFSRCDPAAGSLYCTWNGQNGAAIQMQVRTLTGGLPIQVQSVTFSP
jgi:hypothetical protein